MLEAKDMLRRPSLATFDWRNGFSKPYLYYRKWRDIVQISKPNLWFALIINVLVIGALDAAAIALAVVVTVIDLPILIFLGFVLLMTAL